MSQICLGIDPGLAIIGWAILQGEPSEKANLIDCGTIETAKDLSTPQRLVEIEKDMVALIHEGSPRPGRHGNALLRQANQSRRRGDASARGD